MALEALTNYVKSKIDDLEDEELSEILTVCKKLKIRRPTDFDIEFISKEDLIKENLSPMFVNKLFNSRTANRTENVIHSPSVAHRMLEYVVPYDALGFSNFLDKKKKDPRKELCFCNKIIDLVIEEFGWEHPKRPLWKSIAKQLTDDHHEIFQIEVNGAPTKNSSFLMRRLENRFNHLKGQDIRNNSTANDLPAHPGKKRKLDLFGTKRDEFAPSHPTDMTPEELENMRADLIQQKENNTWNLPSVRADMKVLYSKVRVDINNFDTKKAETDSPIHSLKENWPFCFLYDVITDHFNRLTGIDAEEKLENFRVTSLDLLLQLLSAHKKRNGKNMSNVYAAMINSSLPQDPNLHSKFYVAMRMVAFYMNEDITALVQHVLPRDEGLTDQELTTEHELPRTPVIVAIGPTVCHSTTEYRIVMDKVYVVARLTNFIQALIYAYAAHFVFNIHYSTDLKATMEYLQTGILHMVPDVGEGSKSTKKGGGSAPERRHLVTRLINEVEEFKVSIDSAMHDF